MHESVFDLDELDARGFDSLRRTNDLQIVVQGICACGTMIDTCSFCYPWQKVLRISIICILFTVGVYIKYFLNTELLNLHLASFCHVINFSKSSLSNFWESYFEKIIQSKKKITVPTYNNADVINWSRDEFPESM